MEDSPAVEKKHREVAGAEEKLMWRETARGCTVRAEANTTEEREESKLKRPRIIAEYLVKGDGACMLWEGLRAIRENPLQTNPSLPLPPFNARLCCVFIPCPIFMCAL